jgi:hypothetical protein
MMNIQGRLKVKQKFGDLVHGGSEATGPLLKLNLLEIPNGKP